MTVYYYLNKLFSVEAEVPHERLSHAELMAALEQHKKDFPPRLKTAPAFVDASLFRKVRRRRCTAERACGDGVVRTIRVHGAIPCGVLTISTVRLSARDSYFVYTSRQADGCDDDGRLSIRELYSLFDRVDEEKGWHLNVSAEAAAGGK